MNIIKSSIWIGIGAIVKMLSGIVSMKIIAIFTGPSGVALLGNFMNFSSLIASFSNGALGSGIAKYVSESNTKIKKDIVVVQAIRITVVSSTVIGIIIYLLSDRLYLIILGDSIDLAVLFKVLGFSIIFYGMNLSMTSILTGYRYIKYITLASVLANLVGIVLAVVITIRFGLFGALLNTILLQLFTFIVNLVVFMKLKILNVGLFKLPLDWIVTKKLLKYSALTIVSAIMLPLSLLFVRNTIINEYSIVEAGYIQGVWSITGVYISIIILILSTYFLPTISGIECKQILKKEIDSTFRFILPTLLLGLLIVYFIKDYLIIMLYSKEFLEMSKYFRFHLLGDFFRVSSLVYEFVLVAKAQMKAYVIFAISMPIIYMLLSYYFIISYGAVGESYAYFIQNAIHFLTIAILMRKRIIL